MEREKTYCFILELMKTRLRKEVRAHSLKEAKAKLWASIKIKAIQEFKTPKELF